MATYVGLTAVNHSSQVRVPAVGWVDVDEVQRVVVDATAGQFKLTYSAQTTADIAFNAAASAVETALVALSNIGPGDVTVTGGPGNSGGTTPYVITFGATLAHTNVAQITGANGTTPLSGGGATITTSTTTAGSHTIGASGQVKLVPGTVTLVNVDDALTRKALNYHRSFGQYAVAAVNASTGTAGTLPTNT